MYVNPYLVEHLAAERVQDRARAARAITLAHQMAAAQRAARSMAGHSFARLLASLRLAARA